MKIWKSINNFYNKLSNFGKILVFIALLLILIVLFKQLNYTKEGMTNNEKFISKDNTSLYDNFYADIYDYLVYSSVKNNYEIGAIINSTSPIESSVIADIGCGTGHHVGSLSAKNLNVIGIDTSTDMIKLAKEKYPNSNFKLGNALDRTLFNMNSLTHVLCLYFTIYYFPNKKEFFNNCMDWLMPGGYLIVHLVDREKFDPILPPGNPLYVVSPQKYAKERITKTKVTFNNFVYNANFDLNKENNIASFHEKFKFKDGSVRKNEHKFYMEDTTTIVNMAQDSGFIIHGKVNLVKCAYEHQFLYIFMKPS